MTGEQFAESILSLMDKKHHWAWPAFTRPGLSKAQLLVHFRHEFHTYVRDFPVLLARVLGQGPPDDVRDALARNICEEQTGHLSFGVAHPALFLEMMAGLGLETSQVLREGGLEPEAVAYRAMLDRWSETSPWLVGGIVLTIFVEGSVHERAERQGARPQIAIEEAMAAHPMVRDYACPPNAMRLLRAHRMVEGDHRRDAWDMLLRHVPPHPAEQQQLIGVTKDALAAWLAYRDGVARAMGLHPPVASGPA